MLKGSTATLRGRIVVPKARIVVLKGPTAAHKDRTVVLKSFKSRAVSKVP